MAGIAGICSCGKKTQVDAMLDRITHRGHAGRKLLELNNCTIGIVFPEYQKDSVDVLKNQYTAEDRNNEYHFARAIVEENRVILDRDMLGVKPLYYGFTEDGFLCFASEVKSLLVVTSKIYELLPGHKYDSENKLIPCCTIQRPGTIETNNEAIAKKLYEILFESTGRYIKGETAGVWLSGGLDSSIIAVVVKKLIKNLHTFSIGLKNSPDIENARRVADHIKSEHHEIVVSFDQMITIIPDVIYYLESFDALLVRSSITNFIVAGICSKFVPVVFSGECSDELFAGYQYLKKIDLSELPDELLDIIGRLHNTALQRVDRSASAHGLVAQLPFANPEVVEYALKIPVEFKIKNGIEKWILRKAFEGMLPESILNRTKAKFWEGAGIGEKILQYAEKQISDSEFENEYRLKNGWELISKEELFYYRIFREKFGEIQNLSWMGRTK